MRRMRCHIPSDIQRAARRVGLKLPDMYAGSRGGPSGPGLAAILLSPEKLAEDARSLERQLHAQLRSEPLGHAVPTTIVAAWAAQIESLADRLERVIR